jgi:hypothetical protein
LKHANRERVAGGEGGGVEIEDLLERAGVERCVDVYELYTGLVGF